MNWVGSFGGFLSEQSHRFGVCILSLIATLLIPCLPLFVEFLKSGAVREDNLTLTAAVLASVFIFTAGHMLYFCLYILLCIFSLLINLTAGPTSPDFVSGIGGSLLASVVILQASERIWWHMVMSRPFPEQLELNRSGGGK